MRCRLVHGLNIQRLFVIGGIRIAKRILFEMHIIFIGAFCGMKSGMQLTINRKTFKNSNVFWQNGIEAIHDFIGKITTGIKVCIIVSGMHTSISSATADNGFQIFNKNAEGLMECRLHRYNGWLYLPATVLGSIISKVKKISGQFAVFFGKISRKE